MEIQCEQKIIRVAMILVITAGTLQRLKISLIGIIILVMNWEKTKKWKKM